MLKEVRPTPINNKANNSNVKKKKLLTQLTREAWKRMRIEDAGAHSGIIVNYYG